MNAVLACAAGDNLVCLGAADARKGLESWKAQTWVTKLGTSTVWGFLQSAL